MRTPNLGFVRILIVSLAVATIALVGESPRGTLGAVTITVNTTNDDDAVNGNCTLREAIVAANTNANVDQCAGAGGGVNDLIAFNLGSGTPKIEIAAMPLPPITEWAVIDGNTGGASRVEINGPGGFVGGNDGLEVGVTGAGTEIRSMVINNSADDGILIHADEVLVVNSIIGLDATGTVPMPNGGFGIQVHGNGTRIGQTIDTDNCVSDSCDRNIIAGSAEFKSHILIDFDATGAFVRGNFIGTDITGTMAIAGNSYGIVDKGLGTRIGGAEGTTPGGSCTGQCNLVSGNPQGGILLQDPGNGSVITGNFIGTDVTGTQPLGNANGGVLGQAPSLTIGGTTPEARNIISGNPGGGVQLTDPLALVTGNYIGTDTTGTVAIANSGPGVLVLETDGAVIGGTTVGAGNVISGASELLAAGIVIALSVNTNVLGNFIGVARDGVNPVPNLGPGIYIFNKASNNIIGGVLPGSANIIAENGGDGVLMSGFVPQVRSNTVSRNSIYENFGQAIRLSDGANDGIARPQITSASASEVSGTACAFCTIEIFSDGGEEGRIFEGSVLADVTGTFTYLNPVTGPNATATATDASNNTSEFSDTFPIGPIGTPTPTPSPTATTTPEPTATPTATPATTKYVWGDIDCNGTVGARDNQALLRYVLDQPPLSVTEPCPAIGPTVSVDGTNREWGDNDCNGQIGSRDNQGLLRLVLDQNPLSQTEPCPDIGDEVEVGVAQT
jgi:CSLREA domain-containing protein